MASTYLTNTTFLYIPSTPRLQTVVQARLSLSLYVLKSCVSNLLYSVVGLPLILQSNLPMTVLKGQEEDPASY